MTATLLLLGLRGLLTPQSVAPSPIVPTVMPVPYVVPMPVPYAVPMPMQQSSYQQPVPVAPQPQSYQPASENVSVDVTGPDGRVIPVVGGPGTTIQELLNSPCAKAIQEGRV